MMKTTVIIPNYNGEQYLKNCLCSLVACKGSFHVLIVDNGSTDNSMECIKSITDHTISDNEKKVEIVLLGENTGFSKAVNVGIQKAETEYVILLNNDTQVDPLFIQNLEETMDKNPNAFSVSSRMMSMHQKDILDDAGDYYCALGWAYARGKGKCYTKEGTYSKSVRVFAACGGASIYRRKTFDEIGLFDEEHFAYLEDIDIGYRARIYGYQNLYEPDAVVYHAGSASSGSRYNSFKIRLSSANSIYIIGKNMPLLQWILNLPLLFLGFMIKWCFFCRKGYGKLYARGLCKGLGMCFHDEGKKHHIRFKMKHFCNYLWIELELLFNIIRRFYG